MAVLAHSSGPRRTPCTGTRAREVANGGLRPVACGFRRAPFDTQRFKLTLRTKPLVLVVTLVLDVGGKMNHKLSSRFETVDFEGAAKLTDS